MKKVIEKSDKMFKVDFGYDSDGKMNLIKIQGYKKQ